MPARVVFDKAARKWFGHHLGANTTVCQCPHCLLYYKPSLVHRCEKGGKGNG